MIYTCAELKLKNKLIYIIISTILLHRQGRHCRRRTRGICLCLRGAGVGWAINRCVVIIKIRDDYLY